MSAKRLLILPGYSSKNKDWVDQTADSLKNSFLPIAVYWPHWINPQKSAWIENEVEKLLPELASHNPTYLVAKSVGTLVAMQVLERSPNAF
jgi:predicted alpha/beta hydrolase family esterase